MGLRDREFARKWKKTKKTTKSTLSPVSSVPLIHTSTLFAMASNNSNPSSEVSIEEIGAEEVEAVHKEEGAQEIVTDDSQPPRQEEDPPTRDSGDNNAAAPVPAAPSTTAVTRRAAAADDVSDDEDDDDFDDETLYERLVGLTEMFPESVRKGACALASGSVSSTKWLYSMSRSAAWVVFSSGAIMFLPVMIETERMGIEEAQKQQQRQILLGPGAAVSGAAAAGQNAPLPPPAM